MVGMLRWGYRIPLSQDPPLSHYPLCHSGYVDQEMDSHLAVAVEKLLQKDAIEEVQNIYTPGFYSVLFLRPKATGGWRPIIDLKQLNPYIPKDKQKQETQNQIRSAFSQGQWTISVDLTDAFFHIPIHRESRHLLRFSYRGKVFQYKALPFGLKTAPWIFTRTVSQIQAMPEMKDIPIHFYLDDWIVAVDTPQSGTHAATEITALCGELGLLVNLEKSDLVPSQVFTYLGATYNLATYTVYPTTENFLKVKLLGEKFLSKGHMPARKWLQLVGLLNSQEKYTDFGRWRMRHIQWCLRTQWQLNRDSLEKQVYVTKAARRAISWWMQEASVREGTPVRRPEPDIQVQTDASEAGWGGHSGSRTFSGTWSPQESCLHINLLEMKAVLLTLKELKPALGSHILVSTDNTTVMAYINHQGGLRSWPMFKETEPLLQLAEDNRWSLTAKHVPGKLNVLADLLSRRHQAISTEWRLHPEAVKLLCDKWGPPNIDLFATHLNKQFSIYVSPVIDPGAWQVDALSFQWENLSAYAFPPYQIMPQVLHKIKSSTNLRLILVAPLWERQPWVKELQKLATEGPVQLPKWHNLLSQPHTGLIHRDPTLWNLHAWLVAKER